MAEIKEDCNPRMNYAVANSTNRCEQAFISIIIPALNQESQLKNANHENFH
jgi:hypothetical protein